MPDSELFSQRKYPVLTGYFFADSLVITGLGRLVAALYQRAQSSLTAALFPHCGCNCQALTATIDSDR